MSTPGRRRALKALARAKRVNRARVEHGQPAVIAGETVSPTTYKRRFGSPGNAVNHRGGLVHGPMHDLQGGLCHEKGTSNCGTTGLIKKQ